MDQRTGVSGFRVSSRLLCAGISLARLAFAAQHPVAGFTFAGKPKVLYVCARVASDALHLPYSYDPRSDLAFLGSIPLDYESAVGVNRFVSLAALKKIGAVVTTHGASVAVSLGRYSMTVRRGAKTAVVDKSKETLQVFQGGALVLSSPISTGKFSRSTPVGVFRIGAVKDPYHASSKYGDAPMPWAVQVRGAVYIHGGTVTGRPESHGCIRLPDDVARWFYNWAEPGTVLRIRP